MGTNLLLRKVVVGAPVRALYPLTIYGRENLPVHGPFILAPGPHITQFESVRFASALHKYDVRFYVKGSYATEHSPMALLIRLSNQIYLNRLDAGASEEAIEKGIHHLATGGVLLGYTTGTRTHDRHVHKGRQGIARTAHRASILLKRPVPVFSVGYVDLERAEPEGARFPHPGRAIARIGRPLYTAEFLPHGYKYMKPEAVESRVASALTKAITREIVDLSGYPYADTLLDITEA